MLNLNVPFVDERMAASLTKPFSGHEGAQHRDKRAVVQFISVRKNSRLVPAFPAAVAARCSMIAFGRSAFFFSLRSICSQARHTALNVGAMVLLHPFLPTRNRRRSSAVGSAV